MKIRNKRQWQQGRQRLQVGAHGFPLAGGRPRMPANIDEETRGEWTSRNSRCHLPVARLLGCCRPVSGLASLDAPPSQVVNPVASWYARTCLPLRGQQRICLNGGDAPLSRLTAAEKSAKCTCNRVIVLVRRHCKCPDCRERKKYGSQPFWARHLPRPLPTQQTRQMHAQ